MWTTCLNRVDHQLNTVVRRVRVSWRLDGTGSFAGFFLRSLIGYPLAMAVLRRPFLTTLGV